MRSIACTLALFLVACQAPPRVSHVEISAPAKAAPVTHEAAASDVFAALGAVDERWNDRHVGFSNDDVYLGYESNACDPCANELTFEAKSGRPLAFGYYYDPPFESEHPEEAEKRRAKNDATVEATIARLGVGKASDTRALRGPFPYPDVRFAKKTTRDEKNGTVTLWFGGSSSGRAPVFPMHVTLGPHPTWKSAQDPEDAMMGEPDLVYANVTRDGSEVGIVALSSGSMWVEMGGVARMSTAAFVAKIRAA